ncbi:hypothetical protein OKW38_000476 [Paraburkholderia sp. MM5496-R1]|uniref:hypothetical protein n=1 Tax=unclassified Paraburkholderia TaxID=2615204 RepID=UPI003D2572C7
MINGDGGEARIICDARHQVMSVISKIMQRTRMRALVARITIPLLLAITGASPQHSLAQPGQNSLIGVVTDAPSSSKWVGGQVTFTGITTAEPTVVWPDGFDEKLSKLFENENLIVLQFVSTAGGTDTFYIERKSKRFLVVSVGTLFAAYLNNKSVSVSQYRGYIR